MSRPRPKYQVSISSTFADLRAERQAVTLEVLAARHIPSGMESFLVADDRRSPAPRNVSRHLERTSR
jgi:hypothetical protein